MGPYIENAINLLQNAVTELVAELCVANWQSIEPWTDLVNDLQQARRARETPAQIALLLASVDSFALGYGRGSIREFGISDELVDAVRRALKAAKDACDAERNK